MNPKDPTNPLNPSEVAAALTPENWQVPNWPGQTTVTTVSGLRAATFKEETFVLRNSPLTEVEFDDGMFKITFSTGPDTKVNVRIDDPDVIMALVKQLLESMKAHNRAEEAKKH